MCLYMKICVSKQTEGMWMCPLLKNSVMCYWVLKDCLFGNEFV